MQLAFYNPVAGGSWFGGQVRRACRRLEQIHDLRLVPTARGTISSQTRQLLTPDVSAVFACGGDGTVSDVAAGLIGTDIPLCIIPCGTTNVLAREFELPRDPVRAIEALTRSSSYRMLRTWTIGDRPLVLGAGVGWDARLMHHAPAGLKRRFGMGALMPLAIRLAVSYDFPALTITGMDAGGGNVEITGTSVLISNIRYWASGNRAIPVADPADDLLEVVVLQKTALSHLLTFWGRLMLPNGRPLALEGVRLIQMRSLTVMSSTSPMPEVHVNGDPAGRLPVNVQPSGRIRVRVAAA
jgi:diacylglycerol kinase family enzyme